jgi:hypothetical protein
MAKIDQTVIVREVPGEEMRFRVESWSNPAQPHTVDLLAYKGAGECSCTDWQTRRWPAIRDGATTGTRCRHVIAARSYFLDSLLATMAEKHRRR